VRIPLDYYRILGLPIQATTEQLRQAHRDRTLQLPRREYSDAAIAARKYLLDQAYATLSDADQRETYDASFLATTYEQPLESDAIAASYRTPATPLEDDDPSALLLDPNIPTIDIVDDQFMGALLILQELGEYELVLKLGRPFLTGGTASLKDGRYGDPTIVSADIVLTVALACLELGREQWQQGQYENAAEALETGQQLLLREGIFLNVRGEIQSDLYRLRPYRILELLSMPDTATTERQVGVRLLQDMLAERGGIDGNGDDQSGLNIDDFLRFIQQLRTYLTAEEQQALFEQEANRPSAVAIYLSVYVLLARGFADRQPGLIQKAKHYLLQIGRRQDVNLERAISSLLLGQTEEANRALEQSQEQDSLAFIRQHSQGSPDLLPGLCLYTDRWFQDEVFPHFRDLSQSTASLKEYFADRRVQIYLEDLPLDDGSSPSEGESAPVAPLQPAPAATSRWGRSNHTIAAAPSPARPTVTPLANSGTAAADRLSDWSTERRERTPGLRPEPVMNAEDGVLVPLSASGERQTETNTREANNHDALIAIAKDRIAARQTSDNPDVGSLPSTVSTAERVGPADSSSDTKSRGKSPKSKGQSSADSPAVVAALTSEGDADPMPTRRSNRFRNSKLSRWLWPLLILLGVISAGLLAAWIWQRQQGQIPQTAQAPSTASPSPSPSALPSPADPTTLSTLDKSAAQKLVEQWLAAKADALGKEHDIAALETILTDPSLSKWRTDAEAMKQSGEYNVYEHAVKQIEAVEMISLTPVDGASPAASPSPDASSPSPIATVSPSSIPTASGTPLPSPQIGSAATGTTSSSGDTAAISEQAKVVAVVSEKRETFRGNQSADTSPAEELRVQYNLVRREGKWRIQDWQVL
jgi:hypothetical protein